jgi:CelD/BcsL family acetyltransferase involved in cellulose biosynthesis
MVAQRSFRVFRGKAGLFALQDEWKKATSDIQGKRFFHLYEWYLSYLEALETDHDSVLFFVAHRDGGDIEGIFPLKRTRKRHFGITATILESPSHPHLSLRDILICGNADHSGLLTDFVNFVAAHPEYKFDIIRIENALEDSGILELMAGQPHVLNAWEETGFCNYLPVVPGEQHSEGLSKSLRTQLRKARNKASRQGGTRCLSARDPGELRQFYRHFLDVEGSGWKKADGTAIILHPSLTAFYDSIMRHYSAIGACEIDLLVLESAIIAAQFSLVVDKTMYVLKIGYDEQCAELSPGGLLLQDVLERYESSGAVEHVNLVTDMAWHRRWRPKRYKVFCCHRFNTTIPGLLAFASFYAKRMMRVLRRGPGRRPKLTPAADSPPH